ncbi:hypothetical protein [Pseudooceanicola sp.]|uniref:hypothetical protein n=1 Tax=Pseudooceanicola sp. TaxID=1914328 RepID=UPI002629B03D|nr:hypothetical protein [Pseudooceanicola sp.]MDF1853968.1 hypothetical protein [Pseudooceanicola sp.]
MKHTGLILAALLASATPLAAEDKRHAPGEGLSLMERGAQMFFRGLMSEMEPALKELQGFAIEVEPALRSFAKEMGPALSDILRKVEDFSVYHPPVILPNGDIIMRRKVPLEPDATDPEATPETPDQGPPGKQIDL